MYTLDTTEFDEKWKNSIQGVMTQVFRLLYLRNYELLEQYGMHPGQPQLLMVLLRFGTLSQKQLAQKLFVKPATVAVMLKRMEKTGWVSKEQDKQDKRITRVCLTDHGREIAYVFLKVHENIETECLKNFTIEERILLRRLLLQIKDNVMKCLDDKDIEKFDEIREEQSKC